MQINFKSISNKLIPYCFSTLFFLLVGYSLQAQVLNAGNDTAICAGDSLQLGGSPTATGGGTPTFNWSSSPAGFSSTDSTPTVGPTVTTSYFLADTSRALYDTIVVIVGQQLAADFGLSEDTVCSGTRVYFYDSSSYTSAMAVYSWTFGTAGSTSSGPNPSQLFMNTTLGSSGINKTVNLTVTDSGCVDTHTHSVRVKGLPSLSHADYGAAVSGTNAYTNCVGSGNYTLELANLSTTSNSSYTILWGDGDTTTRTSWGTGPSNAITHTYTVQGYHYLNYSVTSTNGCTDMVTDKVFHGSSPVIGLTSPGNTTGCSPYTLTFLLNFRDTSGIPNFPGTKYTITSNYPGFTDSVYYHPASGLPDSTFTFTFNASSCGYNASPSLQNGFYIEAIATNQCASAYSSAYPIHINSAVNASFTNTPDLKICQGDTMVFSGSDSTGTSIAASSPHFGCNQALKKYWTVTPMTGVNITNGSLGSALRGALWNGSINISIGFDSAGTYTIQYILGNYCGNDTFQKTICVVPSSNSSFQLSNAFLCTSDSLRIVNTSSSINSCDSIFHRCSITTIDSSCSPSMPYWLFIDSTDATSENPVISFLSSGLYAITLYDSSFCRIDSITVIDTVAKKPEISFKINPDALCANSPLSVDSIFVKNCYDSSSTYLWTYSGGTVQFPTQENPGSFSTDSAGQFVISLTVSNRCSDSTFNDTIRISANPIISFASISDICIDVDTFTLAYASPTGGTYYSTTTPNYISSNIFYPGLAGAGTHPLYYRYTDSFSCTALDSTTITVHPLPNTNAGNDTAICLNDTINLNPTEETNHTYTWFSGGSLLSTQTNFPVHPLSITSYILLDSNNITGCTNFDTITVAVDSLPAANAGIDSSICLYDSIQLGNNINGYNYAWTSNPSGFTSSISQPSVSPSVTTTYFLSVNAGYQCYNFDTIIVTVDTLPNTLVGNADTICAYDSIQLWAASVSGNSYLWTSNPTSSIDSVSNPMIYPLLTTTYRLIETIDATGCIATDSVTVSVNQLPVPVVSDVGICYSDTVTLSVNPTTYISYTWSPSTGLSSSTGASILAYPAQTITYVVTATDVNGCIGLDTSTVTVFDLPLAIFSIDTGTCGATSITPDNRTDTGSAFGHDYLWTLSPTTGVVLDDTLYEPSIYMPPNTTNTAITYTVILTSTSQEGCIDKDTQTIVVYPKPLADFSFSLADSCSPDTAFFTNSSNPYNTETIGSMSFTWDFGSTLQNPNKLYANTGVVDSLYSVQLISETMHGCRDTVIDTVTIHPDAHADFSPAYTSGCASLTLDSAFIALQQYPGANDTYTWTIFDSDSATVLSTFTGVGFTNYVMAADGDTAYVRLITSNNYGCKNDTLIQRFTTIQDPVADFTLSDTTGCGNTQITLTDATNPTGIALRWDFGDGDTSTATNPVHTFTNSSNTQDSTYSITLSTIAGTGCLDTIVKNITLNPIPKAVFSLSSAATCAPDTLTSTNATVYKGASFTSLWSVSHNSVGVTTNTSATPTFSFPDNESNVDTIYTISLRVTSIDGCIDSITDSVTIYSRPLAIFSIDTGTCGATSITPDNRTDTGSAFGHDYLWTLSPTTGVVLDDTLYEPSIYMPPNTTNTAITYTVILTSTSQEGCIDKDTQTIVVYPKPLADFSFSLADSCSPDTAFFTNSSNPYNTETIGSMSFTWDFGSTLQNPNKLYANTGVVDSLYSVQLISETMHGCRDTVIDTVTIHPDAHADFSPAYTSGCASLTLDSAFIALQQYPGANDTYTWTIFDSDSATVLSTFTGVGFTNYVMAADGDTAYVRLITSNNYGCKNDTLIQRFTTIQDPVADFTLSDTTGCGNTQITLTDATNPTGIALRWDFGDGDTSTATNPVHTFTNSSNTQDSTYSILLIATAPSGCFDSIIKQFSAYGEPLAKFRGIEVCEYKNTVFNDSSLAGGAAINNWDWDFDDATTSTLQNPTHTYNQDGTYNVKLLIINGHGCKDSITKAIESYPIPLVGFEHDTIVCEKDSVFINNTTTGATQYTWSFGNGNLDTRKSPNAYYDTIGFYTIRQLATSSFGCYDSINKSIQVIGAPQASFVTSIDEGCAPLEVVFDNRSIAEYATYFWDYGQGQTSSGLLPDTIVYEQGRHDTTYYVLLRVSNQCNIDTFKDSILVHPTPVAIFKTDRDIGCSPLNLLFSNNLTYGDPDSLFWDFGDGSSVFTTTINTFDEPLSHSFTTDRLPSDYTISYIAKNGCGADTASKTITVYKNTEAFFNTDTLRGCLPLTVNFTNSSRGFIDYQWDFGDGNASNINNPSHTFNQSGTFTVKLFVTDSCSYDTFKRQVLVYPEPAVSFNFIRDSICQFDSIRFFSTTTDPSGIYWNFGDGDSSKLTNVVHQFDSSGIYNIRYTAYTALHNCSASIDKDVHILPRPKSTIIATPTDGCPPLTVSLTADSSFHSWTFSNGNRSTLDKPKETFFTAETQWIKLVSEYANGCKDSTSINLVVHPRPLVGFVSSIDSVCEYPVQVDYINTSIGTLGYDWVFGNGSRSSQINPSLVLSNPGTYNDTLIASNQFGCLDTAISQVKVYESLKADAVASPLSGCLPLEVNFTSLASNYLYSTWHFGNGDKSNLNNDTYTYDAIGSYIPSFIIYGNANCTDTFILPSTIDVFPNPVADFTFDTEKVIATFTNYSTLADTYLWEFGDGETSILDNPVHTFPSSGIFSTTLVANNNFGCKDSITKSTDIKNIYTLFVSNAFSPEFGGSGVRSFKPTGTGIETYHIFIYDTWGNLIWESDKLLNSEPAEGWDGNDMAGNSMPQDTYVWKVSATFLNGRIWPGKDFSDGTVKRYGTVTLLR
jgi:PKD repeat protein